MHLKFNFTLSLLFFSFTSMAQNVSHDQVNQVQNNIQNSIKGTLHGAMQAPRQITNQANQLVFPHGFQQGFSMNPWTNKQQLPMRQNRQNYSGLPRGNPWAAVGDTQNIPLDSTAIIENNPYTDAPFQNQQSSFSMPMPNGSYNMNQMMNSPFNTGFNNGYNGASSGLSMPFGNQFPPSNQFWPGGNNGNSSMPFMPW